MTLKSVYSVEVDAKPSWFPPDLESHNIICQPGNPAKMPYYYCLWIAAFATFMSIPKFIIEVIRVPAYAMFLVFVRFALDLFNAWSLALHGTAKYFPEKLRIYEPGSPDLKPEMVEENTEKMREASKKMLRVIGVPSVEVLKKELIKQGCPPEFAEGLARDAHARYVKLKEEADLEHSAKGSES